MMKLEKYIGSMVGSAVGDTLGMCIESWKPEQIKKYLGKVTEPMDPVLVKDSSGNLIHEDEFGKIKYWGHKAGFKKWDYTDDTILSVAIAKSIVEKKGLDLDDMAKKHVDAVYSRITENYFSGGFGGATRTAVENLKNGKLPTESGVLNSAGNGTVMKISPLGLYASHFVQEAEGYRNAVSFASHLSKMTHLHPSAITAAVVQTHAIAQILTFDGKLNERKVAVNIALACKFTEYDEANKIKEKYGIKVDLDDKSLTSKLIWIASKAELGLNNITDQEAYKTLGNSGSVTESYPFALFMFLKYAEKPFEGLIETVNWGGDADTTAAMYGALAGAYSGKFWPSDWHVKGEEEIVDLATKLHSMRLK